MSQDRRDDRDEWADSPTRTESGEAATEGMPSGLLSPGQVLGERYQIVETLGRGGMGEVWRAFDLKLRVEVALKAMRQDLFRDEKRLEMLRSEVRAAREVVSPNVCRIFDLIEVDGTELVSMEYVDGETLLEVLQDRGPLELKEAQDIASQFLAGLEAIHKAGLVHRDVKPENIMVTRAGRVVVMDFGLARQGESGAGTVAGTPAYMAPEQAAGLEVDARADVYAAGVVLAEMVSPEGIREFSSRQSLWEGVRSEPAKVPETPWAPVLKKAVAKEREQRYKSAHTLTRALEDVTLRVEGAEDLHPYPGLASFTEEDAEYFFGREAEVEQMWRKLERPHMLVLIGPSGAGKSSFLRAGLIPSAPADWAIVHCTPGNTPVLSLSRALGPVMAGDAAAVDLLLRFDDPDVAVEVISRWRRGHGQALLIVDQFEELFTQTAHEVQERFAELLERLALDADAHVLLCMRDDFFFHCHQFPALAPLLDGVTMLGPPVGQALRRALVQPATKCGYRFEDDELVEEMLAEVEGERGALPLLAFAAARLWEKRDRDNGLLTRQAYHDIGGVGGALARHAEETIDRIGSERLPVVRELFRNLVTAEGTRAVREWDELLSIFRDSRSESRAEEVLRKLIDARLLTSYEISEADEAPTRRLEIIHESLLSNWPRLVRWQTQDQEGAQLRDELRQAAKAWDEHGRHDDRLWTGIAYREFRLWQERYPGGLTDAEEAFAAAMTALAGRRRRRRRIAIASILVIAALVAGVTTMLWRRSVLQKLRAEAAALLSQAQLELESYPSAALAYATASLELADSVEARRKALEALWRGPTAFVVNEVVSWNIGFTPDGQYLVQTTDAPPYRIHVIGANGSDSKLEEDLHEGRVNLVMDPSSGLFSTQPLDRAEPWALWSAPERRLVAQGHYERFQYREIAHDLGRRRMLLLRDDLMSIDDLRFDGTLERLGTLPFEVRASCWDTSNGSWFAVSDGGSVYAIEYGQHGLSEPRRLERLGGPVTQLACDPLGRFVAARYDTGEIRLTDPDGTAPPTVIQGPPRAGARWPIFRVTQDGSFLEALSIEEAEVAIWIWSLENSGATLVRRLDLGKFGGTGGYTLNPVKHQIVSSINPDPKIRLWPLGVPADAAPVMLQRGDVGIQYRLAIDPRGRWLASSGTNGLTFWPIERPYPTVLDRYQERVGFLVFGPDARWLATSSIDSHGTVRLWRLEGDNLPPARVLHEVGSHAYGIAASPDGSQILLATHRGEVQVLQVDGGPPHTLTDYDLAVAIFGRTAISPDGHLGAAYGKIGDNDDIHSWVIQVWDLSSYDSVALIDVADLGRIWWISFALDRHLLSGGESGLLRWDLETGGRETVLPGAVGEFATSADDARVLVIRGSEQSNTKIRGPVAVLDLEAGTTTPLTAHGDRVTTVAMDAAGTIAVTGDEHGTIRVGPITGEEPHLLLGRPEEIYDLAVDPKGRWIASSSGTEVRLWPMPDLTKPPLHTLPREELIAKLKTLTNLRVVRDEESPTGWTLNHDPFPGWETVPSW